MFTGFLLIVIYTLLSKSIGSSTNNTNKFYNELKGTFTHNEIEPDIFALKYRSIIQFITGDGPIQPVIPAAIIDTMLNNSQAEYRRRAKFRYVETDLYSYSRQGGILSKCYKSSVTFVRVGLNYGSLEPFYSLKYMRQP